MDCMKYNDHKPLDTAAQRIYMQLVKKYGCEPACAGKFAPQKFGCRPLPGLCSAWDC